MVNGFLIFVNQPLTLLAESRRSGGRLKGWLKDQRVKTLILIVASNSELSRIWARHLERQDHVVHVVDSQQAAVEFLYENEPEVLVLDVMLDNGSAIATADFASYRCPSTRIVFVTRSTFFADGSLFQHIPNTAAIIPERTKPTDLAEIVAYHGRAS